MEKNHFQVLLSLNYTVWNFFACKKSTYIVFPSQNTKFFINILPTSKRTSYSNILILIIFQVGPFIITNRYLKPLRRLPQLTTNHMHLLSCCSRKNDRHHSLSKKKKLASRNILRITDDATLQVSV